jgi:hypothetical protein|mmetsp:Transcript_35184/g.58983  ORF Transcript_35184/g.58983 Transcript_35184/m.58983 type:complete len:117 (-) Transcript_35184:328-678(-)|eukprot:CAMPEP_0174287538 /NCGR_PEP_ID=MMETSP0809-20121228/16305_1 /TAXON_ID=73025 ORGANISM="Eutreptiella gymnastica-like, Strain CCMP1594" /NCGR_SAMPLE_ID=MMETSP0809 /ASSEMBLY_ACC=CAM_ASM_000658 /LENGTH=116 /DNA_ID=CAMNT_0015384137 /DNA_START=60 /DNA_END=410 /DNA_ORIENTATION=+
MVLVEESRFLLEMGKMFAAKKAKGTVWLTIKKHLPPVKKADKDKPVPPQALVRCTDGKRTVGTVVGAKNVVRFQIQFANLMKLNMDNLKKSDKKKSTSAKPAVTAAVKKKGTQKSE